MMPSLGQLWKTITMSSLGWNSASKTVLKAIIKKTNDAKNVTWLGHQIWQFPLDAWIIQEMITSLKPDLIIETGTYRGGSAFYYASICVLIGHGQVLTIDISAKETITHKRITYLNGSSIDNETIRKVKDFINTIKAKQILVILDALHTADHVKKELEIYSQFVPLGSYIHVQDGNIDELFYLRKGRPGPKAAAKQFLKEHPEFIRDKETEYRYVMTAHPYGWLKRIS